MELSIEPDDDDGFIARCNAILRGIGRVHAPAGIFVVRIDNWFGPKWATFSGKRHGGVGVWNLDELTLPPFVPSRVVSQTHYRQDSSGSYEPSAENPPLHVWQESGDNLNRPITRIAPGGAFVWVSGKTAKNGRGSLMAYLTASDGPSAWYAGFVRKHGWQFGTVRGVPLLALVDLENRGKAASAISDNGDAPTA